MAKARDAEFQARIEALNVRPTGEDLSYGQIKAQDAQRAIIETANAAKNSTVAYQGGEVSPWQTTMNVVNDLVGLGKKDSPAPDTSPDNTGYFGSETSYTKTPKMVSEREREAERQAEVNALKEQGYDTIKLFGKEYATGKKDENFPTGGSFKDKVSYNWQKFVDGISNIGQFFDDAKDIASSLPTPDPTKVQESKDRTEAARELSERYGIDTADIEGGKTAANLQKLNEEAANMSYGEKLGANALGTAANYAANLTNAALVGADALSGGKFSTGDGAWSSLFSLTDFAGEGVQGLTQARAQAMRDNTNWLGKVVLDIEGLAVEQVLDRLLGGGSGLVSMALRTVGAGAQEGEDKGLGLAGQVGLGLSRAGVEIGLEALAGIGGSWRGTGYGERAFQLLDSWIAKKTNSELLGTLVSAYGSEMVEEMLADVANPIVDRIFKISDGDESFLESVWGDGAILYDGFIGGLVGSLGGAGTYTGNRASAKGMGVDIATYKAAERIASNKDLRGKFENFTGVQLSDNNGTAITQIAATLTEATNESYTARDFESGLKAPQNVSESVGDIQSPPSTQTASTNAPDVLNSGTQPTSAADILVQMANGQYVPTQTNSSDPLYTAAERGMDGLSPESSIHVLRSDATVDAEAEQRYTADRAGEQKRLFESGQTWTDTDTALAHRLLEEAVNEARRTGDYSAVVKMQREWERQGTAEGQALRQRGRFINTPEAVVAEAATLVYDEAATRKLKPKQKAGIMETVVKFAQAYNAVPQGDTAAIIDLIKQASETRRTTGFFRTKTSKPMAWALEQAATMPDGDTFLRDVLITQIRNIAGDYARPSVLEQAKQIRYLNMLSKLSTVARNLVANNILDPLEQFANNQAVPLDMLLSKFTGTRSIAVDRGAFSAEKWSGKTEGFIKSYIQVALDADIEDVNSKYEQRSGRTFKMTGNLLERFLSTWEKYESYALKTTDETKKGGIRAEAQRGIDALLEAGKIAPGALADQAERIALDRTLQKDGVASKALSGVRSALDVIGIKDKQGGTMGLGSNITPFARVPANALVKSVQFTPGGLVESAGRLVQVLKAAADGTLTAQQQADFVNSVGRTMTGIELTSLAVAAALKGIITVAGSDDKDREASEKADGLSGTQLNLSALGRWLSGEDTTRKDGDTLIEVGFAEQLNAALAMGAAIADAYEADGDINAGVIANANVEAVLQSVLELPALSQFSDMINAYNYSKAETEGGKVADALGGLAANILTSYAIPNALRGISSSSDVVARDMYTADTQIGKALDYAKAGIPGARQTLPVAVDGWGRDKSNTTGNRFLDVLNNNILPGRVTQYNTDETRDTLAYLSDLGIKGIYPDKNAPNSIQIDGEKVLLDAAAKREYQQTAGQLTEQYYSDLIKSPVFDNMSVELQEETLKDIKSMAEAQAAKDFKASQGVKGKDLKTDWDTALLLNDPATYLAVLAMGRDAQRRTDGTFSVNDPDVFKLLIDSGTSNDDLQTLSGKMSDTQKGYYDALTSKLGQNKANDIFTRVQTSNEYGDRVSAAEVAMQLSNIPGLTDEQKLSALEAYQPPKSEDGKRNSTLLGYEVAMKNDVTFDQWTGILSALAEHRAEVYGDKTGKYSKAEFSGALGYGALDQLGVDMGLWNVRNLYNDAAEMTDAYDESAIRPTEREPSKDYRYKPGDVYSILGLR